VDQKAERQGNEYHCDDKDGSVGPPHSPPSPLLHSTILIETGVVACGREWGAGITIHHCSPCATMMRHPE
jgi:hypothetical protein